MADEYIIYNDEEPGWENTQWKFLKGAWDGNDIPVGADHDLIHVHVNFDCTANKNMQYEWNTKLENGSLYYRASSPSGEGKFAGFIRYNNPTNDYCHIKFNGYKLQGNSVVSLNYSLSSAVSGSLSWSSGTTVDVTQQASSLGGRNEGSTIGLSYNYEDWQFRKERVNECIIDADFPIFKNWESLENYIRYGNLDGCINLNDIEPEPAKKFYIYNTYGTGTVKMGVAKITQSVLTGRYENLMCLNIPCLYWANKGQSLELRIKYKDIQGSYYSSVSRLEVESADIDDYTEGALIYSYPFYYKYTKLPDGTYNIGSMFSTNMPLFKDEATAQAFIDGEIDITDAENWPEISGDKNYDDIIDNDTGEKEEETDFGESFVRNIFSQMYLCNTTVLYEISNALFDYDVTTLSGLWEDIKKGLEMYGSNPMECVQGLRFYPLDLSSIFHDVQSQNYVYFGAYKLNLTQGNVQKIIYANGYKDLGTVKIKRAFKDWRDFEPYTKLSIYLPYVGRYQLDLKKYYDKDVTVRYYIDIRTGACIACLIADGLLLDWFDGILGVEMPITLTDYSSYAQNQLNIIMRNAGIGISAEGVVGATGVKGVQGAINGATNSAGSQFANTYASMGGGDAAFAAAKGASSSAMASGAAGIAGTAALGAVAVGAVAAGVVMKTEFDMMRTGTAAYTRTRPASSSMLNQFLPQYPTFMFEIQDIDESEYLNELYGRPANASGVIGNFSGYLEAEDVLLICPIATDNERQEIIDLVKTGIYI